MVGRTGLREKHCSEQNSAMPSVTPIPDDIFETEIQEFYVPIQSTKIIN